MGSFDNSLFPEVIEIDGENWLFESVSCGQHKEIELEHYFINKKLFDVLTVIWGKWHLKEITSRADLAIIDEVLAISQDIPELAKKAIKIINN